MLSRAGQHVGRRGVLYVWLAKWTGTSSADRLLSKQDVFTASFLALVGIAMTIYLILFLTQPPVAAFASIAIGK